MDINNTFLNFITKNKIKNKIESSVLPVWDGWWQILFTGVAITIFLSSSFHNIYIGIFAIVFFGWRMEPSRLANMLNFSISQSKLRNLPFFRQRSKEELLCIKSKIELADIILNEQNQFLLTSISKNLLQQLKPLTSDYEYDYDLLAIDLSAAHYDFISNINQFNKNFKFTVTEDISSNLTIYSSIDPLIKSLSIFISVIIDSIDALDFYKEKKDCYLLQNDDTNKEFFEKFKEWEIANNPIDFEMNLSEQELNSIPYNQRL